MKKATLTFLTILQFMLGHSAFAASEKFFCALPAALEYKDEVTNMPGTDKTKHCSISCIVALECSAFETYLFGLSKEIFDAFGGGTPDRMDIEANKVGIKLATTSVASLPQDCLRECLKLFPSKN